MEAERRLRDWSEVPSAERIALQAEYQGELDRLPPTCSLETKVERFSSWLEARGVHFSMGNLGR